MIGTAILIDRASAERAAPYLKAMAGGWEQAFVHFAMDQGYRFVAMLAHTHSRLSVRDPIVHLCKDGIDLRHHMRDWSTRFRMTPLQWQLFMEQKTANADMVMQLLPPASSAVFA